MTLPGLSNAIPPSADWMAREIRRLSKEIAELRTARSGNYTTITGTLDVEGTENVSGDLNVTGNAEFGGNMAVTGTLSLPAGIIDNAALANPVTCLSFHGFVDPVTVPINVASVSLLYSGSIIVPAGFTQAHVLVIADVGATNGTAGNNAIYCAAGVDGSVGEIIAQGGDPGAVTVSSAFSTELTGLTGGDTITVQSWGSVDIAGWVNGNAHVSAQSVFLR